MSDHKDGVSRHSIESEVSFGGMSQLTVEGELNHVSGEVTIEVSGAESDRPDTYRLQEQIQDAVCDVVRNFEVQE